MIVTLDTETHPIARGQLAPKIVCVQWCVDAHPPRVVLWSDAIERVEYWLADPDVKIVGANIAYDMACFAASSGRLRALVRDAYAAGRVRDVLLDGKLLDIAAGKYEWAKGAGGGWSLEALAGRLGLHVDKDPHAWRLRFAALDGVPVEHWPEGAREYALGDVIATRAVHEAQEAARASWAPLDPVGGWSPPLSVTNGLHGVRNAAKAYYLHRASCWGVLTASDRVADLEARAGAYRERVGRRLQRAKLVRPDGSRDTKAAARAMVDACERVGREVPRTEGYEKALEKHRAKDRALCEDILRRGSNAVRERKLAAHRAENWSAEPGPGGEYAFLGGVSLDRDACILSGSRVLELYAEYTGTGSLWSRVATLKEGFVQPLQTRFDPLKETGRTSSTQPGRDSPLEGDQMQNHARAAGVTPEEKKRERGYVDAAGVKHAPEFFIGTRECYRPRDGNVFVGADYSMAELHTLAQTCRALFGYSHLGELLKSGVDVHWYFAAKSVGMTIEELKKQPDAKRHRDRAKPLDFGIPGGMGPDKIILYSRKGYGVRFERDEVVHLRNLWLETFPEVRELFRWVQRQLGERETFTHVHPITGFVRGDCWYTDGCNHGFQHLCAYGAGDAIALVGQASETSDSPLFGWSLWNFVHDELLLEGPVAGAHDAAIELKRLMELAFNRYVPDVPLHAEPFVTYIWSKKVELCHDANDGRITPWMPPQRLAA